ncbi:ParA family protein [Candidatus Margulisiibacteriota bacterium]
MKKTKIIAVVNQKGGVGKTTSAINLSSFLSEEGYKTLVIDMDPQANATSGLGLRKEKIKESLYEFLLDASKTEKVIYPTPFDNLHVIPSTKDLVGAEVEMVQIVSRETILKERLQLVSDYYDYIIIDCPPSLGLLTVNALVAADKTLIPVQCEYFALEGLSSLLDTIRLIKDSFNPNLEVAGILLTMFDQRTTLNKQVVENAKEFFQELVFETIIPRNIRLSEAPSHGLPVALYYPKSKGSLAYMNLAKEVITRVN